ncbi:Hypothetical protein NTJ_14195 [Nesidiocoris tenuis]|nr:Hypothetical protein NTJ_14195 [Nesidiocoris tenuis]
MERLSPIHEAEVQMETNLICATPSFKNDVYAIEMTSSPETGGQLLLKASPRPRRRWRESRVKRPKSKTASKNVISTPLSNLISRTTIQPQQGFTPESGPKVLGADQNNLFPAFEKPAMEETPVFAKCSLPGKGVTPHPLTGNFNSFLTGKLSFSDSKYAPLSGIVVKKSAGHNRSMNVSAYDADLMEVDSDDENVEKDPDDLCESIETFPSPVQLSKHILPSTSVDVFSIPKSFESARHKSDSKIDCGKQIDFSCVEVCGIERKKPKRALDFGSDLLKSVAADSLQAGDSVKDQDQEDNVPESACDSFIGSAPKFFGKLKDDDDLCGFTQCSKSSSDWDFPIKRSVDEIKGTMTPPKLEVSKPAVIVDDASVDSPPLEVKVPLEFISDDDTSSDQSNEAIVDEIEELKKTVADSEVEDIDDPETHPLHFNITKSNLPIKCVESPTKKMFSEAVNIEAAYSPDSHEVKANEVDKEETIETTATTQEDEIEESEDVRPRKRLKKGTLVEQAAGVISRIKASQKLFEYEIKANLCPSSKKHQVSTHLVVCHKWIDDASTIVHMCKPLKRFNIKNAYSDAERSFLICILANETSFQIPVGAVVVVHFPITVIICSRIPYVLAGSRLVHQAKLGDMSERVSADRSLDSLISIPKISDQLTPNIHTKTQSSLRVFPTCVVNSVVDAAFIQGLVDEIILKLKVVHVARDSKRRIMTAFCVDDQHQPCMIEFRTPHDIKRTKALEMLHIFDDGLHIEAKNFVVVGREAMGDKLKTIFSYSFNGQISSDVAHILTPSEPDWLIVSSGGSSTVGKTATNFADMSAENCGKRYLCKIVNIESCIGHCIVKDSSGCSLKLLCHDEMFKTRCLSSAPPFLLDGVFFIDNVLQSDEYTVSKKVQNT